MWGKIGKQTNTYSAKNNHRSKKDKHERHEDFTRFPYFVPKFVLKKSTKYIYCVQHVLMSGSRRQYILLLYEGNNISKPYFYKHAKHNF